MRKLIIKQIKVEIKCCDNCEKESLSGEIYDEEKKKVAFILCNKCLITHLSKTFVPEYEQKGKL